MRTCLFLLLVTGCSGSNFAIANPADTSVAIDEGGDDGTAEVGPPDSSAPPDDTTISPGDTTIGPGDTTIGPGDTTIAPDTNLDSGTDSSVVDSGVPDTTVPDVCVKNTCGGCAVLKAEPGTGCGICSGKYSCKSPDAVGCDDSYKEDTDTFYGGMETIAFPIEDGQSAGIFFPTRRAGWISEVSVAVSRVPVDTTSVIGNLRVRLYRGGPVMMPAASDMLGTQLIPAESVPTGSSTMAITFAPTTKLAVGDGVFIDFADQSARYNFRISGAAADVVDGLGIYYLEKFATAYKAHSSNDPYLIVKTRSCP